MVKLPRQSEAHAVGGAKLKQRLWRSCCHCCMGSLQPGCHMWSVVVRDLVSQAAQTSIATAVGIIPELPLLSQRFWKKKKNLSKDNR